MNPRSKILLIVSGACLFGIGSWLWQSGSLCGLSVFKHAPYCRYLKHNKDMQQAGSALEAGNIDQFIAISEQVGDLSPDLYKYLDKDDREILEYIDEIKAGIETQ